ncbi:HAMP domain-containing sensor histidine kinase [Brevibacterium yomogidense]|uniref:sensor histidine kinase n=1 Tax=Brevibacterium yomogidense TaxID=946573 RepID=UPI0031E4F8FA
MTDDSGGTRRSRRPSTVRNRHRSTAEQTERPAPGSRPDPGGRPASGVVAAVLPGRRTVRGRVLAMMLAFMAAGLVAAGTVTYTSQFEELENRVDLELRQEIDELALVAQQSMEQSPLGLEELLHAATGSVAPGEYESVIALVDGSPRFQPEDVPYTLSEQAVLAQIRAAYVPGRTVFVDLTVDGEIHRAAVAAVSVAGDDREGIFVVANRISVQRDAVWRSAGVYAGTSLALLIVAAVAGHLVSGRLMRPLGELREATESITPDDLDMRVTVPDGDDDVASLARTFNTMLDRIDEGFVEQRRFMSDVSHELRTPLTIIRGTMETTDLADPDDVAESRQIALEEVERMDKLVSDLSTLAKARRPDFIHTAPVDLAQLGARVLARIEHLGDRDWVLESDAQGVVMADSDRLIQAVVQLAANAVRFSADGSRIRLRVTSVGRRPRPGAAEAGPRSVLIALRDAGTGIPADRIDTIFERFVQVDASGSAYGSGLGLSIVKAIAEGHGGRVQVDSKPGIGSEFSLILPLFEVPPVPSSPPPAAPAPPRSPAPPLPPRPPGPPRTAQPPGSPNPPGSPSPHGSQPPRPASPPPLNAPPAPAHPPTRRHT